MSDTQIKVDTGLLREYASRLKKVNSRLKALEGDLEALYRREGLVDIGAILRSGDIGWSKTIDGAATYLLETAEDFENVEKEICDMLARSMQGEHPFAYFDDGQQPQTFAGGLSQLFGNAETYDTSDDLYTYAGITLAPGQLEYLSKINERLLEMLDERAYGNIASGVDNLATIFSKLDYEQQEEINLLVQGFMDTLSQEQKTDLRFLNSNELVGIDFQTRETILQHLKQNNGEISYNDLVDMGVCQPESPGNGGFAEWLMGLFPGGKPSDLPAILEEEYLLNQKDTSFAQLDAEERQRRAAENAALFAMAAAPLVGWGVNKFKDYANKMMNPLSSKTPTVKSAEPVPEPVDPAPPSRGTLEEVTEGTSNTPRLTVEVVNGVKTIYGKPVKINSGQQDKHIPGTNNYMQEIVNGKPRSILSEDPNQLLDDYSGTGQKISDYKERIDFGKTIGQYYDEATGTYTDTSIGIVTYGNKGAHIIPARPK